MSSDVRSPMTTICDRYELREVVGRGGMGEVWAALDTRLHRDVAVKMLNTQMASEPGVRARFDTEARSAARLNHPNVVSVFDTGEHEGVPFLVMELLPGRTLADEMRSGPIEPERALQVGVQVLAAVGASHAAGILHRDIKPGNILITADGTAKVSDFGIAKSTEGLNVTSVGMVVGTASYLAPERVAGQPATVQSDLYAVGVVLYEALSGRRAFEGDTPIAMMRAIESGTPAPLSDISIGLDAGLAGAVERAMDKDPARRFETAAEMAAALRAEDRAEVVDQGAATVATAALSSTRVLPVPAMAETTEVATPRPTPDPSPRVDPTDARSAGGRVEWVRKRAAVLVAAATVALFVLILMIGLNSDQSPSTPDPTTPVAGAPSAGALPADLERSISRLEEAVRP